MEEMISEKNDREDGSSSCSNSGLVSFDLECLVHTHALHVDHTRHSLAYLRV